MLLRATHAQLLTDLSIARFLYEALKSKAAYEHVKDVLFHLQLIRNLRFNEAYREQFHNYLLNGGEVPLF